MSSLSTDRKQPLDYGVQIRFIKDLDDTGGGYPDRVRGTGPGGVGLGGTPPSSKYGVAVRVQGISGQPYVMLKDGDKGDSYGVQLKTQPQTSPAVPGRSTPHGSLPRTQREGAHVFKDPYAPVGASGSPEEEEVGEFGSPLRRPPGDGQAGSQGEGEGAAPEQRAKSEEKKEKEEEEEELNEAGLRKLGSKLNSPQSLSKQTRAFSIESFPGPPPPPPEAFEEEPVPSIDTNSLAPINKLISKFNSSSPSNTPGAPAAPAQTRGRTGARAMRRFDERRRSRSLDARKAPVEVLPPSPTQTINPYAPPATPSVGSPKPATAYSSLGRGSASVAMVTTSAASKAPTFNQTPKSFVAKETPPALPKKPSTPDLLRTQSQSLDITDEGQTKQAIFNILKEGSIESESSLKRKVSLIHEKFSGLKTSEAKASLGEATQLQQQLAQSRRQLQDSQDQLVQLRMEREGAESRLRQQEDQLAQLQEELRRVAEDTPQSDALQTELVSARAELAEAALLRQRQEETLRQRERELTALKGALKDEVASHDREMEALREQFSQNMETLRHNMEHVSQSQHEIEEERQKVNASIMSLEEELEGCREQGDHWRAQLQSASLDLQSTKEELAHARLEKKEIEEKLMSTQKQTVETDGVDSLTQELQSTREDLKAAQAELERQRAELEEKEAGLQALKKANEEREAELQAEIGRLTEQAKQDKKELTKAIEMSQQSSVSAAQPTESSKEMTAELQETNNRLRERLARMRLQSTGSQSGMTEALEDENCSLRSQLEEARRGATRLSQEKEELNRRLEEREREREALRRGKSDLEDQKRLLDRALEKINKEMEMMMGDSRQSVVVLQGQLEEYRERSRRDLQEAQRHSKERLADLQRAQANLKTTQEEVSRLKKELLVCSEEKDSAQLDRDLLNGRLKHLEMELDTERSSHTDRGRDLRLLEDKVKSLEIELEEEKNGVELMNDRILRSREQVDQLRSELMQERSARHDLEMDKSALERQAKELRSRVADLESQSRPPTGTGLLEAKVQELEERLRSEEREKSSILAAQRRTDRKLKDVNATLDLERNQHAEQRDQLSLRVKALKRQLDESEGEVERLEGVRRKVLRELEEQQELKEALQAKVGTLENELKRKAQQMRRPTLSSALSSDDEDGPYDSSTIASILAESQLQTTNC